MNSATFFTVVPNVVTPVAFSLTLPFARAGLLNKFIAKCKPVHIESLEKILHNYEMV